MGWAEGKLKASLMTTIHKDKEECQAALSQGEHLKYQILHAGVTFRLSQYCSLSTARAGGDEQGELENLPADLFPFCVLSTRTPHTSTSLCYPSSYGH